VQPARNHQVKYEPKIVLHSNGNALADASYLAYYLPFNIRKRRLHGAKQKRASQSHTFKRLPNDAWFESTDVGGDIWQFRHFVFAERLIP